MAWFSTHFPILLDIAHVTVVLTVSPRAIMRRPATGVALAWLFLVAVLPLGAALIYVLVGERRIGLRRARRIAALRTDYKRLTEAFIVHGLTDVPWDRHRPEAQAMDRLFGPIL